MTSLDQAIPLRAIRLTRAIPASLVRHGFALALIAAMSIVLLEHARRIQIQVDESGWITSGVLTYRLVMDRAGSDRWANAYEEHRLGQWGNMNPPVGKFLIGLFASHALTPTDSVAYRWEWDQTHEWNRQQGNMPPPHVLLGARAGMVVVGTLCLLFAYLIALQITGPRWIALWAPVALFCNPDFRATSAIAYTNVPQLLFLLAATWLFVRFLQGRALVPLIGAVVAMGLACAVKFNAAPLVAAAFLFALHGWPDARRRVIAALGVLAIPLVTFVAVNPYLYRDPVQRTLQTVRDWSAFIAQQQQDPTSAQQAVRSPAAGATLVLKRAILTQRAPTSSAPSFIEILALTLVGVCLAKRAADSPPNRLRQVTPWVALLAGCAIAYLVVYGTPGGAALMLLIAGLVGAWRGVRSSAVLLFIAVVFAVFAVTTAFWLPFDWARYYLPVSVWIPLLQVAGLTQLMRASPN